MALNDLKGDYEDFNPASTNKVPAAWYNTVLASLKSVIVTAGAKYSLPGTGIPENDLSSAVKTKLNAVGGGGGGSRSLGTEFRGPLGVYPATDVLVNAVTTSAPAYSSPVTYRWDTSADRFRYGGVMAANNLSSINCGVNVAAGADPTNQYTWTGFEVEFWVPGPDFTVIFRNFANSDYLILIDDMPIKPYWLNFPTGTGLKYHQIRLTDTDSPHRVRVLNGINGFVGVLVPGAFDEVHAAAPRFQMAMTGDSYLQGAASASESGAVVGGGICGIMALKTGVEVINLGQGTTGYIDDGGGTGGRSEFGSADRLAALNVFDPDCIVIFGGGNDTSETAASVATAANTMWNAVGAAHPNAALIVVGIQPPDLFPFPSGRMQEIDDALAAKAALNANVDLFISMRTPEYWVTDATKDLFITYEALASIHPGTAGSDNIVDRMLLKMRGLTW